MYPQVMWHHVSNLGLAHLLSTCSSALVHPDEFLIPVIYDLNLGCMTHDAYYIKKPAVLTPEFINSYVGEISNFPREANATSRKKVEVHRFHSFSKS